jgi:hypothetical protein
MTMAKPPAKNRHEGKSGAFNPSKRPPRGLSEKTDRSSDGFHGRRDKPSSHFTPSGRTPRDVSEKAERSSDWFHGRKDRSSEHFTPSGRTPRDVPEKTDRSGGDFQGRREGQSFPSFDRPKREPGFTSGENRPVAREQARPVSAAALKRGFARAKDEITGVCDEISALMAGQYNIGQVELTVSFNSAGEFIGFGAGGAASIKITVIPSK